MPTKTSITYGELRHLHDICQAIDEKGLACYALPADDERLPALGALIMFLREARNACRRPLTDDDMDRDTEEQRRDWVNAQLASLGFTSHPTAPVAAGPPNSEQPAAAAMELVKPTHAYLSPAQREAGRLQAAAPEVAASSAKQPFSSGVQQGLDDFDKTLATMPQLPATPTAPSSPLVHPSLLPGSTEIHPALVHLFKICPHFPVGCELSVTISDIEVTFKRVESTDG